jgi:HSP20 family protein
MAQQVRATEVRNGRSELAADVYETAGGEAYVIEVPVPGLKPDEINIEVTIDTVTISTEPRESSQDSGRRYFQREQPTGRMSRVFEFPMDLDTDNVQATLENGILKLRLPKAGAARRRIVKVGQLAS